MESLVRYCSVVWMEYGDGYQRQEYPDGMKEKKTRKRDKGREGGRNKGRKKQGKEEQSWKPKVIQLR